MTDFPRIRMVKMCCGRDADDKTTKHGWRCLFRPYRETLAAPLLADNAQQESS